MVRIRPLLWLLLGSTAGVIAWHLLTDKGAVRLVDSFDMRAVERDVSFAKIRFANSRPATLLDRMRFHGVRGMSLAVIRNYRVVWAKGYGFADVDAQKVVTPATRFQPGSISKSLNAVAVLRLALEQRADLDGDVNRYLTSWRFPYDTRSGATPVTLRGILSHTAGLSVHGFWGHSLTDSLPTIPQILDGKPPANNEPVRSLFRPGLRFKYSGGGTMISQQVVMDLTGLPYANHLRKAVLDPLGMTQSTFEQPLPAALRDSAATGYDEQGRPVPGKYPVIGEQAAGGLWTTATDLARFIIAVQQALAGRATAIITPELARLMVSPPLDSAPGLGLFLEDHGGVKYFAHAAGNPGYMGKFVGSIEGGNGVVAMVSGGTSPDLLDEVVNTVATVYRWPGFPASDSAPTLRIIDVPADSLKQFAGVYREGTTVVTAAVDSGRLTFAAGGAVPWRVYFTAPNEFVVAESPATRRFVMAGGRAVAVITTSGTKEHRAERVELVALSEALQTVYAGTYRDPDNVSVTVARKQGGLWLTVEGLEREMRFLSPTEFFTPMDHGAVFRFELDGKNRVRAMVAQSGARSMTINRASP